MIFDWQAVSGFHGFTLTIKPPGTKHGWPQHGNAVLLACILFAVAARFWNHGFSIRVAT